MISDQTFQPLLHALADTPALAHWGQALPEVIAQGLSPERWGDLDTWQQALADLPPVTPGTLAFRDAVNIGTTDDCSATQRRQLQAALMTLHPWRKGPFDIFGIHLDTEWRSDWKWQRLIPHIEPLVDRLVLDIGCGNGYHCWRMLGAGARRVIGIDPSPRFVYQFYALKTLALRAQPDLPIDVLPLGIEALPQNLQTFDTVFSMGVLYHRRSPMDHLRELKGCLKPGGQLVLETLVIDGEAGQILVPEGRYAKMPNVWFIPSAASLLSWLRKTGFGNPRLIDVTATTPLEQRRTDWMTFESLSDFLDPDRPNLTVEGHPAPVRAIVIAEC